MKTTEEHVENKEQQPGTIQEGKAQILVDKRNIFYNPVQEFNRDLSITVLTEYSRERNESKSDIKSEIEDKSTQGLRILEALSATGLRSIRYAKEVPGINEIVANDISATAVEAIKKNIEHNGVKELVTPNHNDATMVMYTNRGNKFDVIDLDPYGCPSIFLDGAIQCIKDGGLLMVTATDMAVLAGNSPETCYVKYGAISLKIKACHEMALRILLQHIASHAGRYGKFIIPVISISADFYIRVFVKVYTSQQTCKDNTSKLGLVYHCKGCESFTLQPLGMKVENKTHKLPQVPAVDRLCEYCKHKHHMGGPIWTGPLHDKNFVYQILTQIESGQNDNLKSLKTLKRIQGILHVVYEELDNPLYYQLDRIMSIIKSNVPPMVQFRSAFLNAGYKVSLSHANKNSIKTNAPNQFIWDVVRAWEKENPVKREKMDKNSAGYRILTSESVTTNISFEKHLDAVPQSQQKNLTRFQINPAPYWGPGTRSTTHVQNERGNSKKEKNQNKNKRKKSDNVSDLECEKSDKKRNIVTENPE